MIKRGTVVNHGPQRMTERNLREFDKIKLYTTLRYICTCQAYFQFAEFDIVTMNPSMDQDTIHLYTENAATNALEKMQSPL